MRRNGPIRVLLIDDSQVLRERLSEALHAGKSIVVVGAARDAVEGRELVIRHRPDVIVLDLELPGVDALEFLGKLREAYPVPVLMCSDSRQRNGPRAIQAIEIGALDVLLKPGIRSRSAVGALAEELAEKIRVAHTEARPVAKAPVQPDGAAPSFRETGLDPGNYLVVVGASTGGTEALRAMLSKTPVDFPATAIVQHMPADFTGSFADRLDGYSPMHVSEAGENQILEAGHAVIARGDTHLIVRRRGATWRTLYTDRRPVNRHCPSVDVLFDSAIKAAGPLAIGILLTGMGSDGGHGLLRLRQAGALTLAQDRESCVIYGMPKVAANLGAVQYTGRPEELPELVLRVLRSRRVKTPHASTAPTT